MSTPTSTTTPGPADDETNATTTPPRRRRGLRKPSADQQQHAETEAGTAEVVYLGDSEEERLARIQGRIRTKKGRYLRSLTDLGNVERYLDEHAGDLLYVDESERWRRYNGRHWTDTTKDRDLHKRVVTVLRGIWQEAQQCRPDTGEATEVRKWAKKSEERSSISAVKSLLVSECAVSVEDFDPRGAEADTLNLANGTLDLETFELRPHRKEDMLAKFSPVFYDPTAECPNWLRHLEWAIPDAETRETIQRYFGYALTTETREQKMLCFYGARGRNGKGVIVRVMERILGYDDKNPGSSTHAYAQAAPATMLLDGKRGMDAASPDMARLVGKRFVSLQETAAGQKFSEVRVNMLTGGDTITARFMHKDYFEFTPVAKYVLCTNNRPEVTNDNPALWRRLFLVNFPNSITDAGRDADPDYEQRIQDELSGILNWALDGLRKWRDDGLKISAAIRADTDAYRAEQDWFGQFMSDCLEEREGHLVSATVVYAAYRKWATDSGQGVMAQRRFGGLVSEKVPGFYKKRAGNPPEWYYGGLALREGAVGSFDTAKHPGNPVQRDDPGAPPAKHTAYYASLRRAAQEQEAAAQEAETATAAADYTPAEPAAGPTLTSVPDDPPLFHPAAGPAAEEVREISELCAADRHEECITSLTCSCGCHGCDDDGMPLDEPDPEPDEVERDFTPLELVQLAEVEVEYARADQAAESIDHRIDSPAPQFSERAIVPWTVKMSAYVDLESGDGITDDGTTFEVRRRGRIATLAELLRAVPAEVGYVHLTGADIGTDGQVSTWANTRLPKGWTSLDHSLDGAGLAGGVQDARSRVSLRYRRPGVDGKPGAKVVIYRAAGWFGDRGEEAATRPAELREAFALLLDGIRATFGEVCGGKYGVPLKGTPGSTGLELIRRTLPRERGGDAHRYPILDTDIQHIIRSHAGQGRTENYAAHDHPSGGAHIPDRIPGLYVYDMRFAYAGLLDLEMPTGPVIRDRVPEFARRGSGWEPCLYRVRVTVPAGWDRVGPFRTRDGSGHWIYPDTPGTTFEAWCWERTLHNAARDGWTLGEHVQIVERIRFTGPKTKPLAAFGRAVRELRDGWIPAQDTAPERVRELARIMARQIAIAAVGKLSGTTYSRLCSAPFDAPAARPDDGVTSVWVSEDGKRWEWREETGVGRDYLVHPEWSAYIWGACRDWLYSHPTQRGVGLRHVPRGELVAARTDGFWTTTPQPVRDTGKVGAFRAQLAHDGEIETPRTFADLQAVRALLTELVDLGGEPR